MKKLVILTLTLLVSAGCQTMSPVNSKPQDGNSSNNQTSTTPSGFKADKSYENSSAVELIASVNVNETVSGDDTPTAEAGEKIQKITKVNVTFLEKESGKLINTYALSKVDTSVKGEILRFKGGIKPVAKGKVNVKYVFQNEDGSIAFENIKEHEFTAKSVVQLTGDLNQVSIKKDPASKEQVDISLNEMKEEQFVKGEFLAKPKKEMKDEELKSLLETNGIKVTEMRKGSLNTYTIKFSEPSTAEAMILADKTSDFEYIEVNGIVSISPIISPVVE